MSSLGKEQAHKIAGLLEELKDEKYIMNSSDPLRAKNTALIVGLEISFSLFLMVKNNNGVNRRNTLLRTEGEE